MSPPPVIDALAALGEEHPFRLDAAELLRRMDQAGIALAVARPVGGELVADARAANRRVTSAGPRVRGLATANPWLGDRACDELRRARDLGAVGLYLHPSRQGFMPIEPVAEPLLRLAADWDWPVVFHTGSYVQSDVLAVAEIARRLPATPVLMATAGFTDMWFELPGVFAEHANLWLDTSMIWSAAVQQILQAGGVDRVVFAGGEPRNRYATVLRALARLELSPSQSRAVLHDNARRLYRLP